MNNIMGGSAILLLQEAPQTNTIGWGWLILIMILLVWFLNNGDDDD